MGQFEDMSTFVRIIEAGSISRAADQLSVAKSAVSRRLVDLEGRLGVQLLSRTTRKSNLTEIGQIYYQHALQILDDVNELNNTTSNSKSALEGGLKVAVPLSFGLLHLTPVINTFAKEHPDITIHLDFADRQIDLIEEGFDLAIRIAELKDSNYIARKLTTIKRVLCASPDYIRRASHPKTPKDLKTHDILHYDNSPTSFWAFTEPGAKEIRINLPTKISANNGDYLCEAAVAGFGIVVLPTFVAWQEIEKGRLVHVMPKFTLPTLNAYAIYPQTRHLSKRVRAFIDFLVESYSGEPYWDKCLEAS
jgi:DNA-binding transcriptional LysR family regulator